MLTTRSCRLACACLVCVDALLWFICIAIRRATAALAQRCRFYTVKPSTPMCAGAGAVHGALD